MAYLGLYSALEQPEGGQKPTPEENKTPVVPIATGAAGALLIIGILIGCLVYRKRRYVLQGVMENETAEELVEFEATLIKRQGVFFCLTFT